MGGKWTICYQRLYLVAASTTHYGDRCSHRISHDSQACLRRKLFRISNCAKKIVDLTIAKGHRFPNRCSMPIILESQNVMAGFPEMGGYAQNIGLTGAIAGTY